ncbi:zinc finger protein RFP-like isoform X2 [Sceloporus undulatus]|uniref:zinc finger protein RFP-like isoform X2 n=1 Tax=Sceloporus undulatus TaxID=8520 RepID=UPI001C4B218A|nr:zinc finger protein RFP-like isoform X2 [Sceloporus undulatus]
MAAAASTPVQALQEEVTCPICLDYLANPVMVVGCGHNFCQPCITKYWKGCFQNVSCPQCRATFPKARLEENRQLKKVVEVTQKLAKISLKETSKGMEGSLCQAHQQPLKLFCHQEGVPICLGCDKGKAHQGHQVVPIQEAHQEFKIGDVKDELSAEVEQFCQFLKQQVHFLLPHLDAFQTCLTKKVEESTSKYTREIDHLNSFISDIEKACEQPSAELLKEKSRLEGMMSKEKKRWDQFMNEDMKEYETTENIFDGTVKYEENTFGELEERHLKFVEHNKSVKEILQRFRGEMTAALRSARNDALKDYEKATLSFDGETAFKLLVLSQDKSSVHLDEKRKKKKPFHQRRFDRVPCVLGTAAFIEGRHYWEIDVEKGKVWGVGVARESVDRKAQVDWVDFAPENGIWGIGYNGGYIAFTNSVYNNRLNLPEPLKKIQVYLDYTTGEVSFVNPDNNALIFTFPPATFGGDTMHPWFWVSSGQLSLPWSEDDYPDVEYLVSTGIIKPWEINEYIFPAF